MGIDKALEALVAQGLLGVFLVLAVGAIIYLYKQTQDLHKTAAQLQITYQQERIQLYEQRLQEAKDLLTVVRQTNAMGESLKVSVEARTVALNELIKGFAALVQSTELSRERFKEQANRMEALLNEIHRRPS